MALLKQGYYLVFIDVPDMFGNDESMKVFSDYYQYLQDNYHLNKKCVLEGFSRGGLYAYNWASKNTDKIFCIYTDAPVCDLNSWPGGKGKSVGSPDDWDLALEAYGLTESEMKSFKGMPIYNCEPIAKAKIPVLTVLGDADMTVPMSENTTVFAKQLALYGDTIQMIVKKGSDHHPHSLNDPKPIVDFITKNTNP